MIEGWYKLDASGIRPLREAFAFDKGSVRRVDRDGRLHVAVTNISKANVCPYLGNEIPEWQELGLESDKIYKLFRAPEELEKAAPTFNNIPLLARHVPVSAEDHQPHLVIGSTGTDAEFVDPYLRNSLVVWSADAIDDIETDRKKELSCGYRYRADMTPGEYKGEKYDGVMRDIVGNHVALVQEGRAGPDVVVGDEKRDFTNMAKPALSRKAAVAQGALIAYLMPKLAADAQIDLRPALAGVNSKNFKAKKSAIASAIKLAARGKLAQDASIDDLVKLLDAVEGMPEGGGEDAEEPALDPSAGIPPAVAEPDPEDKKEEAMDDDDPVAKIMEFLKGKLSEEDMAALQALLVPQPAAEQPAVGDEDPAEQSDEEKEREAAAAAQDAENDDMNDKVSKPAMDAAIKAAAEAATKKAVQTQKEIRDAERAVRPYVGELAMSFDSAEHVYRHTLKMLGVKDAENIHASALPTLLAMHPKAGAKKDVREHVAMDAAAAKSFSERFPHVDRIKVI